MVDLTSEELALVRGLLDAHVPGIEVRAFGSRVLGGAGPHSDLDLAILADGPLPLDVLGRLREAFAESDLTFRTDLVDWHTLAPSFRELIEEQFVVIREATSILA